MDKEELQAILDRLEKSNAESIEKYVNGGIRDLKTLVESHNQRHEADMADVRAHICEVKPILEAYNGTKALGNLAKWLGGIIITAGAVWALIFKQ